MSELARRSIDSGWREISSYYYLYLLTVLANLAMEPEQERNQDEAEIDHAEEPDGHVDDHERLLAKPRTKAAIWSFFGSAEDKDKIYNLDKPLCRKCREPVPIEYSATSNLYTHLRYHHKELYETVKGNASSSSSSSSSQPTIAAAFDKVKPLDTKSKEHKSLTDSITRCLAKDMLPIRTVEKPGFKAMISRFNPKYQLPSRSYFSRVAIPSLYTTTRESVQRSIKEDTVSLQLRLLTCGAQQQWSPI